MRGAGGTGERYVFPVRDGSRFCVRIRHRVDGKWIALLAREFRTLPEAVACRDQWLAEHPEFVPPAAAKPKPVDMRFLTVRPDGTVRIRISSGGSFGSGAARVEKLNTIAPSLEEAIKVRDAFVDENQHLFLSALRRPAKPIKVPEPPEDADGGEDFEFVHDHRDDIAELGRTNRWADLQ